ncbi:DNA polymerase-4/DNA polymerase V [Salsuginibacillus halophilus]|uniref:DNA polymerase IV n=2 Tax=Salsuginibacillus halophilus TaxID=517424 RepID=A0A2P8H3P6_9BACI|nr:DNA polymerase-4/DNA polymerase V [Salsuginibacillus halophilus]
MERAILLLDMQSFYAMVEKRDRPELWHHPVVVAGDPEIRTGVILAACPEAKRWGVKTAETLRDAETKCPNLTVIRPRMQHYIDTAVEITSIMQQFTDLVEPYSIDETFADITHLTRGVHLPETIARRMQARIETATAVPVRIGIASTKVLAKMACDHFAKPDPIGIFHLYDEEVSRQLWPLPIGDMFGVGKRMNHHLRRIGIRTIGQLANYPLEELTRRWGINGEVLWRTAWGQDDAPVDPDTHVERKAIGHHMTLPRDYQTWEEIKVIIRELSEEVAARTRSERCIGTVIHASLHGHDHEGLPAGFHRQLTLEEATADGRTIADAALTLCARFWESTAVRSAGVTLSSLAPDDAKQLSLFHTFDEDREALNATTDKICERYGEGALFYAASLTRAGQARLRSQKIGGHYK